MNWTRDRKENKRKWIPRGGSPDTSGLRHCNSTLLKLNDISNRGAEMGNRVKQGVKDAVEASIKIWNQI